MVCEESFDGDVGTNFFYEKVNASFRANGLQAVSPSTGTETLAGIERIALVGGDGNNRLDATLASVLVILLGGDGNDTLSGRTSTGGFTSQS